MKSLVELLAEERIQTMEAPCTHGNIVIGHACYCHHKSPDAPRKCPIWRNGDKWSKINCDLFDPK